jgi:hypothetical protein
MRRNQVLGSRGEVKPSRFALQANPQASLLLAFDGTASLAETPVHWVTVVDGPPAGSCLVGHVERWTC